MGFFVFSTAIHNPLLNFCTVHVARVLLKFLFVESRHYVGKIRTILFKVENDNAEAGIGRRDWKIQHLSLLHFFSSKKIKRWYREILSRVTMFLTSNASIRCDSSNSQLSQIKATGGTLSMKFRDKLPVLSNCPNDIVTFVHLVHSLTSSTKHSSREIPASAALSTE